MHDINIPEVLAEVSEAFERYEQALVSNDIGVLDELFWRSPYALRYGASENLYGYEAIQAFRKQRPAQGLERTLSQRVITTFGRDFAVANTLFHRDNQTAIGRQSQTWVRMDDRWQIVSAHVSLMAEDGREAVVRVECLQAKENPDGADPKECDIARRTRANDGYRD